MRSLVFCFAAVLSFFAAGVSAADRPNVVWIVSEDNSKHYLQLFDERGVETPNIAAMAAEGIRFDRAFSNSPVCSVARTTLATGCYAPRIGTQYHRKSKLATLPAGLKLFPAYLRDLGYYTTNRSKKDYNCVETEGTWDESSKKATWRNRPSSDQPFFHMQSHGESHESNLHFNEKSYQNQKTKNDPASVILPRYFPDTPLFRYTTARYLDRIQKIDEIVGETIDGLKKAGVLEDTFVFYFGDHGGVLPRSKGYLYESGLHVPLVVRVPENWRHLVDLEPGATHSGFVSFIDFAPTVLKLAGAPVPDEVDGSPFLGEGIEAAEIAERDTAFGYADRFDEKYEMVRSVRVGDWKYIRSYQPHYPDGLQNNYRYKMLAYREWRDLFTEGRLGSDQRHFFQPKPSEQLYDLLSDPDEVINLAAHEEHAARLEAMRDTLDQHLVRMPDLSFVPENVLYDDAMDDPVAYGQARKKKIIELMSTANVMLLPYREARDSLKALLNRETDPLVLQWALTACAAFGEEASELAERARPLLSHDDPIVRVRAAEFLGGMGAIDPRATLIEVVNGTTHPVEQLIALNAAALFHENATITYPFDAASFSASQITGGAQRRIDYFRGSE